MTSDDVTTITLSQRHRKRGPYQQRKYKLSSTRRILGLYWPEVITNRDFWLKNCQEPINTTIKGRRWKWIGRTLTLGEKSSTPCNGVGNIRYTENGRPRISRKHLERPDGSQVKMVQGQKSGSRLREVERNCGRPMPPTGNWQRTKRLDKFITFLISWLISWPAKLSICSAR